VWVLQLLNIKECSTINSYTVCIVLLSALLKSSNSSNNSGSIYILIKLNCCLLYEHCQYLVLVIFHIPLSRSYMSLKNYTFVLKRCSSAFYFIQMVEFQFFFFKCYPLQLDP